MAAPRRAAPSAAGSGGKRLSPWLAPTPGKRWTELFFLLYSPSWILWCLCILVPFKIYEVRGVQTVFRLPAHANGVNRPR